MELWLISSTLTIGFSMITFYWPLAGLCLWFFHQNYSFKDAVFIQIMLRTLHLLSKKPRYWRVQNNVGSHLEIKLCAVKPTILSERHEVISICLSRFSNTESILLTSNFTPLCGTLVNFFDSYNLILSEYFLLTSPWFVSRMLLNELWSTCLYSHYR